VIDLLNVGRLDEAEHAAQHLLDRYPEVHDGLERLAMVAAARGDRARAAEYYREAADFVRAHPDSYDQEMETYLRARATEFGTPTE
jgi:tetratricopeptide (TPR) repeat protein